MHHRCTYSKISAIFFHNPMCPKITDPEFCFNISTPQRLLNPNAVSPKRAPLGALGGIMGPPTGVPGGPPKLGFLAQLTARVGLKSAGASAASEDSSSSAGSAPAPPAAKSLFADIMKFRKPDAEEVSTSAAAAEDKENARAANFNVGTFFAVYCRAETSL
jgi:hypothetical protein